MNFRTIILCCVLLASAPLASAQPAAGEPYRPGVVTDKWTYSITPYVWALGVSGSISHNSTSYGHVNLSPGDLLSNIKMAGMIVGEAHHQRFGLYVDAMYGDLGKTSSIVVGRTDLSANTGITMSMVTLASSYTLHHSSSLYVDGLIGARYFGMNECQNQYFRPCLWIVLE